MRNPKGARRGHFYEWRYSTRSVRDSRRGGFSRQPSRGCAAAWEPAKCLRCAEKSKVVHFGAWLRAKPLKTREFSGCGSMQHPKIEKVMHYGAFWCMEGAEPSKSGEFRGFGDSNDALRTHEKVVHLMQGDERSFSARVGTCERGAHECSRASVPEPALAARLVGRAVALFRGRTRRRAIKPLTSCADAGAREQNRLLRARLLQCNIAIMPKMLHFVAFCCIEINEGCAQREAVIWKKG